MHEDRRFAVDRRRFLRGLGSLGLLLAGCSAPPASSRRGPFPEEAGAGRAPGVPAEEPARGKLRITRLETLLVKPRWLFLKVHTDEGIVGLGEPILEGRAETCAKAVEEIAPYLVGKDPRAVAHHWQAIY